MDLTAFQMLLAVCGGNAGDKDELCSGNGDVDASKKQRYATTHIVTAFANGLHILQVKLASLDALPFI
jgi:hypothetical protein